MDLPDGDFEEQTADRGVFDNDLPSEMKPRGVRRVIIVRRFPADAARVFKAWVDPEIASRWLFRSPASAAGDFDFDLRIGGRWNVSDWNDPCGYAAVGRYLVIEPPRRLAFTMAMPQFATGYDRVTVEIVPDGECSTLTLAQERLTPGSEESLRKGWNAMFDDLVVAVS